MKAAPYACIAMAVVGLAVYLVLPNTNMQLDMRPKSIAAYLEHMSVQATRMRLVAWYMQSKSVIQLGGYLALWLQEHGWYATQTFGSFLVIAGIPVMSLLGALLSFSLAGALVLPLVYVMALPLWAKTLDQRFEQKLSHEMPTVFRMLASALGSGKTLSQALEYVGLHEEGNIARAFSHTALEMQFGESAQFALDSLAHRLDTTGIRMLVTSLSISQRTGSSLDLMLSRSARMVEQQEELERTLSVKTAQARFSVKIVCCLPPVMLIALSLLSPDFQQGLLTPTGLVCVTIALLMDGAALLVIRRLMKGVM